MESCGALPIILHPCLLALHMDGSTLCPSATNPNTDPCRRFEPDPKDTNEAHELPAETRSGALMESSGALSLFPGTNHAT